MSFVKEEALHIYPNPICFDDKSKVVLHSNWFETNYHNLLILAEKCQNSTFNNFKCKPTEEINRYAENTIFTFKDSKTKLTKTFISGMYIITRHSLTPMATISLSRFCRKQNIISQSRFMMKFKRF